MNTEIYEKLKKILTESLHIKEDDIAPDKQLVNDLGVNSLELADIFLSCEDVFSIEVDDKDIPKFLTVGDIVEYLDKKTA